VQRALGSKRFAALGAIAIGTTLSLAVPGAMAVGSGSPAPNIKVTQNAAETVVTNNSIACGTATDTAENHYYRRFNIAGNYAAAQGFKVTDVAFPVEATDGATVPGTVKVWSIDHAATLTVANLTAVGSTAVNLASVADGALLTAPVSGTVPAGKDMVLEVTVPASTTGLRFFIGSNTAAESAPSYIMAPACAINVPTTMAGIGFSGNHIVLYAHGKSVDCVTAESAVDAANAAVTAATTKKTQAAAAVTAAQAAVTTATAADAKAKSGLKKAKAKLKKAKKSGNAAKVKKAKAKVKKAKAAAKAAAAALASANAGLASANSALAAATTALTAAQAAVAPATATATTECAQPTIPAARPAPSAPAVGGVHGLVTAGS